MPIEKDGEPFELLSENVTKYSTSRTYMVPENVCKRNQETGRIEVPNSWHVDLDFEVREANGKKTRYRYYDTKTWDEATKRWIYLPTHFVIHGPLGLEVLPERDYEKHFILEVHPENEQNPAREKYYKNITPRFRTRDLASQGRLQYRRADRMNHLNDRIMPSKKHTWNYLELVRAMETVVIDRTIGQIPYDLLNYNEYKEALAKKEADNTLENRTLVNGIEEGMRGTLYAFATQHTDYCYELWILGERLKFMQIIDKLLTDKTLGIKYDETTRQLRNENAKIEVNKVILTVPADKELGALSWKEWIAKECQTDRKLAMKLYDLSGLEF